MTAKEFLRSKGISADLKTLRLTTRVEDGLIVDWMDEYANQRVIEELEKFILYKQKLEQMFDSEQVVALAVIEELDKKYKELKQ
jgi:hypothetical protein